jgi:hypothetical protein
MQWICAHAENDVQAGSATGFEKYAAEQCQQRGPAQLAAADSSAPGGDLMCRYAARQVATGAASKLDLQEAQICNQVATPTHNGIEASPSQPPISFGIDATTAWSGTIGGNNAIVWAGTQLNGNAPSSTANGAIVEWIDASGAIGHSGSRTHVNLPSSGALTIASADGDALTITSAGGTSYTYNAATQSIRAN